MLDDDAAELIGARLGGRLTSLKFYTNQTHRFFEQNIADTWAIKILGRTCSTFDEDLFLVSIAANFPQLETF